MVHSRGGEWAHVARAPIWTLHVVAGSPLIIKPLPAEHLVPPPGSWVTVPPHRGETKSGLDTRSNLTARHWLSRDPNPRGSGAPGPQA